jgi:hypothetical protein
MQVCAGVQAQRQRFAAALLRSQHHEHHLTRLYPEFVHQCGDLQFNGEVLGFGEEKGDYDAPNLPRSPEFPQSFPRRARRGRVVPESPVARNPLSTWHLGAAKARGTWRRGARGAQVPMRRLVPLDTNAQSGGAYAAASRELGPTLLPRIHYTEKSFHYGLDIWVIKSYGHY